MDTVTLPPSPNWHLSHILACNDNGLLAYGSRGEIAIIDHKKENKYCASFISLAHKEKVNCVAFSPLNGKFKNCLATGGDDGIVRLWDYQKLSLLLCHSGHKDGVRVVGLDWSRVDSNRVVSVNDVGLIVCWDLASNTVRKLHCGIKVLPLCLACCPHGKHLIAVGCKGGVTLVIDITGSGKIVHRLRGNEQDVTSISWCPAAYNVITHKKNEDSERELLLATGGLERFIYLWRAGTDGRFEVVLTLPNSALSNTTVIRRKGGQGMGGHLLWTCVHWVDPYTLLSTSQFGELLTWDLTQIHTSNKNSRRPQPQLLHSRHYKGCFSIASSVAYDMVADQQEDRTVWTTAMDKRLVAFSLTTGSVTLEIPTLGGAVLCMATSPLDPNRLAIGSSDSKLFVWNTSDLHSLNLVPYWKKIVGKVMAVSWHPSEEDLLAFGTSDGHVGLLDVGSYKLPTLLRLHVRKAVYRVCWAPPLLQPVDKKCTLVLYAVGDRDILQFNANPKDPDEEPKSLNKAVLNSFDQGLGLQKTIARSDVAFKSDHTCFAVASEDGSIYIVSQEKLKLRHTLYAHKKLINNLEWHPATVACDNNISPYLHWLASCSETIKVHNIPLGGQPELVAHLNLHSEKIVSLVWSPHFNGRLLSASYDCTIRVWDVAKQSCLAACADHSSPVMCAHFSPLDTDIVYSGANDSTVRFSAISKMSACATKSEKKRSRLDVALKMRSEVEEATELTVGEKNKIDKQSNLENYSNGSNQSMCGSDKGVEDHKKRQKGRAMFPMTANQAVQAKHFEVLMHQMAGEETTTDLLSAAELGYLDFFRDDKAMTRLLMVEESYLLQSKQCRLAQQSMLWRGDVTQMLQEAISKKQLTDWLVSIAPLSGYDMWEEACRVYADQLVECGEVSKASTYLLTIHKVHEAVQLLKDHKLYFEAMAIAKCRLPQDDPLTFSVYKEWGDSARQQGQLLLAAHCYLAGREPQACVEALTCLKELRWLRVAAQVARNAGQTEQASSLELECLSLSVTTGHLAVSHQLIADMSHYQYWRPWLQVCEMVDKVKRHSDKEVFGWLEGVETSLPSLCDELYAVCLETKPAYQLLLPHLPTNRTPEFEREMWSYVSGHVAAACVARIEVTLTHFFRHLVAAFSAAFHFQILQPTSLALPLLLSLLAPKGLFAEGSILITECQCEEELQILRSLKAFACASIAHWMYNNWDKVTRLLEKDGEEYKMAWLPQLLQSCAEDVLDPCSVQFFVQKAQREQLQNVVNKEKVENKFSAYRVENRKLNATREIEIAIDKTDSNKSIIDPTTVSSRVDKTEIATEKANGEKETPTHIHREQAQINGAVHNCNSCKDGNIHYSPKPQENGSFESEIVITTNTEVSSNFVISESLPNVKVNANNIASNQMNLNGNIGTSCESEPPCIAKDSAKSLPDTGVTSSLDLSTIANGNHTSLTGSTKDQIIDQDLNSKLDLIKELDVTLNKFEVDRESVPNPFAAYINIKYLVGNLVMKQDTVLASQIQENCDKLWKISQQY